MLGANFPTARRSVRSTLNPPRACRAWRVGLPCMVCSACSSRRGSAEQIFGVSVGGVPAGDYPKSTKTSKFEDSTILFNDFSRFHTSQNHEKSIGKRFQNPTCFRTPSWIDLSSILGPKMGSKSVKNRFFGLLKRSQFFASFQNAQKRHGSHRVCCNWCTFWGGGCPKHD